MNKNTGNDRTMSYVRKISLVAGSISALALMSTVKAAQAANVPDTQAVSSGEIAVDWDLDALEASDETLVASETSDSTTPDSGSGSTTSGSGSTTSGSGSGSSTSGSGSSTSGSGSSTSGSGSSTSGSGSSTSGSGSGSSTSDSASSTTGQTSGALPNDDEVVATETFTFDVANASSNLVTLSVAATW